jgi:hypothetical protein
MITRNDVIDLYTIAAEERSLTHEERVMLQLARDAEELPVLHDPVAAGEVIDENTPMPLAPGSWSLPFTVTDSKGNQAESLALAHITEQHSIFAVYQRMKLYGVTAFPVILDARGISGQLRILPSPVDHTNMTHAQMTKLLTLSMIALSRAHEVLT